MEQKKTVREITHEVIESFLNGHDPMERIISIETDFMSPDVSVIYVDDKGVKRIHKDGFRPFVWAKEIAGEELFGGNKDEMAASLRRHRMWVKRLDTSSIHGRNERIENGYKYLFYAKEAMSYREFMSFFQEGGLPLYPKESKKDKERKGPDTESPYLKITPTEQYMIYTGKRLFKGYNSYGELHRFIFDLETEGLNPKIHHIEQIGIWTNRGYHKILEIEGKTEKEKNENELKAICEFIKILSELKPDIVVGHNSENFDWNFLIERCRILGTSMEEVSELFMSHPIYKKNKETVLKLGGEVEYFYPTVIWGHNVLDSLHAARRAQATDSNMKSSNLKYVTKYLNMKKDNRVYVPGDKITSTYAEKCPVIAFNDSNGDWYRITDKRPLEEGYEAVSGKYVVERYLLDDLWETDKVEEKLNETNFLIGKWLPTTFQRAATMGTAGIWKLIMLAWSYENDLAVPSLGKNRKFTGGLSRLLQMGYKDRIVKLDFNSLYPATILTWNIPNMVDGSGVLNKFLEYVLTTRELYKGLKKEYGKKADLVKARLETFVGSAKERKAISDEVMKWKAETSLADKKQSQVKTLANSYFGSAGSPGLFPWGDDLAAERTTCLGRMQLRLMISHFKSIDYQPVVGDSVTGDTPLFIKYDKNGLIDIKPISELFDDKESNTDVFGREYDASEKGFKVLCRSGWVSPNYIYRHKTSKLIYNITEGNMSVSVTEDHSLFNDKQEKIKPSEIDSNTKLEYYTGKIEDDKPVGISLDKETAVKYAKWLKAGIVDRVVLPILNCSDKSIINSYLGELNGFDVSKTSKTCRAGIQFLMKKNFVL